MQRRIFLTYTLLLLVGIVITGLLSLGFMQKTYMENMEDKLIANGKLINLLLKERIQEPNMEPLNFSRLAYEYSEEIDARVTFINPAGQVIADSKVKPEDIHKVENHLYRPEIQEALSGKVGRSKRISSTTEVNYIYVAVPLMLGEQLHIITRFAFPLTEVNRINFMLMQNVLIAALCGMIVATILGYRYVNNVTKPIKEITKTAQNIANGALNNRVYVNTSDEIKILADTFNIMTEKLNETISELWDKNTKLQSTLTSMNEALFAVDKSYKIMLMNPVAKVLFKIEDEQVMGKHILEVIRNNKLHDVLQDILNNSNIGQTEITIDYPEQKTLKIYTNYIRLDMDPNRIIGVMALIQDVTEMRKLEKMRSDFVTNVSHELKTPLTSIIGFIETLKNGAIDNEKVRSRFLDIIEIETERLSRLIDDLLSLSAIEHDRLNCTKEKIRVNEVIREIRDIVEGLAKQKEIKLSFELDGSLPEIYGNPDWFKQMMINLVENAIKYTQEGGSVKLLAYRRYDNIFIAVKDTGIGIPKEDIPRLFERFYRVDKGRSKKAGGTGLGLAIVKHIVLSFAGEIKVNSELGKGSEFIIRIPL